MTVYYLGGRPGVGKTTICKKLAEKLRDYNPGGVYSEEIRSPDGKRIGFEFVSVADGERFILAHIDSRIIGKGPRIGRYTVSREGIEKAVRIIKHSLENNPITIIDELGPMEFTSRKFSEIPELLKRIPEKRIVICTVHKSLIGRYPGTIIVTPENRNELVERLFREIKARIESGSE